MGRHGESSLFRAQGGAMTEVLSFYCQVPEFVHPEARLARRVSPTRIIDAVATICSLMTGRSNHWAAACVALALAGLSPASRALDAVVLEVRQVEIDGMVVQNASARLDLLDDQNTRLTLKAVGAALPDPVGRLTDVQWLCTRPVVAEPRFGCDAGRFTARGGPTGSLDMKVTALLRSDTGITTFTGKDLKIAGTTAAIEGRLDPKGWQVKATTGEAAVSAMRKLIARWFELPKDITGDGKVALVATLADAGQGLNADLTAKLSAVDLTNEASTVVTDKL